MQVFISYHSPDRSVAMALRQAIETALPDIDIFLDQSNLRFGYNWQPALYAAIENSDAFLTIIGNRLGNWQTAEYYAAHDKKIKSPDAFLLLPIIIADRSKGPVSNLPGLSQLHWIECAEPTAPDVLAGIIEALSGKPVPEPSKPWMLVNPYRGLMALEEQDSDFFFGRELETERTIEAVIKHPGKVISLIGNSGVGKSSLVQAGAIAGFKRQKLPSGNVWPEKLKGSREWAFLTFRPADAPVKALVSTFVNLWFPDATDPDKFDKIDKWTERLVGKGSLSELLDATRQRYREQGLVPPKRAFVYVDQGEELYNRGSDQETLRLSHLLAEASQSNDFVLMLSQRSDYYGNFQANRELFDRSVVVDVAPLKPEELIRVMREPAARLGVGFYPPELPEQLVEASRGQPGALALLADLMIDVWDKMQRRGTDGVIRALEDAHLIDVEKALASRANRFVTEHPDEVPTIQRLFVLRLIKIYEQGNPFRRRVYEKDCTKAEWAVLNTLSSPDWRLVVTGSENNEAFAEVAHDILLSKWPALSEWIARERQFLLWRTDTDREFNRWLKHWLDPTSFPADEKAKREFDIRVFDRSDVTKGDSELLRGARLQEASDYLARRAEDIDAHLKLFIERSNNVAKADAELASNSAGQASDDDVTSRNKLRVFISYSRRDQNDAEALASALVLAGLEPYFDQQYIAAGEDWQERLGRLIETADTIVFLLSPESITSERCTWELQEAERLSKRVIPFVIRKVDEAQTPFALRRLNHILADRGGHQGFLAAVSQLATALRTDVARLKEHTRYQTLANQWEARRRPSDLLLHGSELEHALSWARSRPPDAPELTELQRTYIAASQEEEQARSNLERQRLEAMAATQHDREQALMAAKRAQAKLVLSNRRQRLMIFALLTIILMSVGVAIWLYTFR